jgi:hypothetical protein
VSHGSAVGLLCDVMCTKRVCNGPIWHVVPVGVAHGPVTVWLGGRCTLAAAVVSDELLK